ncbi:MAG: hypothetical protein RL417_1636 [Pseudomonadota bacterium]|jgi:hypothetical protein
MKSGSLRCLIGYLLRYPVGYRMKQRLCAGSLGIVGSVLVAVGFGVWLSSFLPVWGILVGLGLAGLVAAFCVERDARYRQRRSAASRKVPDAVAAPHEGGEMKLDGAVEKKVRAHRMALGSRVSQWNGGERSLTEPSRNEPGTEGASLLAVMGFLFGVLIGGGVAGRRGSARPPTR